MPRITVTTTILAGQSLSGAVNLADGIAQILHMSAGWTPALMTFQLSPDGINFNDAVDMWTRELRINVLPGTSIRLPGDFASTATGYMKFRSGTSADPIPQAATRTIIISAVT